MPENRPQGRKTTVSGKSSGVYRRGEGQGTGPVGKAGSHPTQGSGRSGSSPSRAARVGGGSGAILIVIVVLFFLLRSCGGGSGDLSGLSGLTEGLTGSDGSGSSGIGSLLDDSGSSGSSGLGAYSDLSLSPYANLFANAQSSGTAPVAETAVDSSVVEGARDKYTQIRGDGQDEITIMVYLCGTDLESRSGMATKDLSEMARATLSDKIHLIVYTGGCSRWNNNIVSANVNQIYEVRSGGVQRIIQDDGARSMTDPSTLTRFIKWCALNYRADRNFLILWDHGGGSVSGYGYDEKNARAGSMGLAQISKAISDSGVLFDAVGFDACLMATVETGLMLDQYADYMIASEETEPGIGWYYTDWLTKLSQNTSMPTVEIGKNIVDDFVRTCASQCSGQSATLSVVDLAELAATVPDAMRDFSDSITDLVQNKGYQTVSNARNGAREFARSTQIDQIDLVHFALNLGNAQGKELADAIRGAVKYNRASSNMTNCYGLSVYFPYRRTANVDKAVQTYDAIGFDASYSRAIRAFASMEVSGQAAAGGSNSPYAGLFGGGYSGTPSSSVDITSLLSNFLGGGDFSSISGLSGGSADFLFGGRALGTEETAAYIASEHFDPSALSWTLNERGETVIRLSEDQWGKVEGLALNMFFDDGQGFIDLGLDAIFDFSDEGDLLAPSERSWLAINEHTVAYYHEYIVDGNYYGTIPALLNGERVELQVCLDGETGYGTITGIRAVYADGETQLLPKTQMLPDEDVDLWNVGEEQPDSARTLQPGDVLDFLCDYYRYDGSYVDTYFLGESLTIGDGPVVICNAELPEGSVRMTYRFTDLYQQNYWSDPLMG